MAEAVAAASDAIVVEAIEKTYPNGTQAVKGISFRVRRAEIFGILGPNGAGKSTAIGMLGTLVRPTGGKAMVDGIDVTEDRNEVRKRIGFAMQEAGVDDLATGREFLTLQGRLYGLPKETVTKRADQLLKLFELQDAADKRISNYSGGMKRRIDLAAALIHFPKILFLDEPTEGLDPRSRMTLWNVLRRLRTQLQTTILLSTHYMEEADKLCDRIAIIDQGRIVAQDTPASLKAGVGGQSVLLEFGQNAAATAAAEKALVNARIATRIQRTASGLVVYIENAAESAPKILRALEAAKTPASSLQIHQPSLDDVYLKLTGKKLAEADVKPGEAKK